MNLIICCTPFQILIASEIIERYHDEEFFLLVLCLDKNKKYEHYYNKFKNKFNSSKLVVLFHKKFKYFFIFSLFLLKIISFFFKNSRKIFIANITLLETQIFINKGMEIFTFDDGTANIDIGSPFFDNHISIKRKFLDFIFNNKVNTRKIRKRTRLHFSIYKDFKNISDKIEYIQLFSDFERKQNFINKNNIPNNQETISIFLGQPLNIEDKLIQNIFKDYHINKYFPHPREEKHFNDIDYINTDLLFEDFLLEEILYNPKKYKIYTFFSGAVLNIYKYPNVEVHVFYKEDLSSKFKQLYQLFEKANISIKHIE